MDRRTPRLGIAVLDGNELLVEYCDRKRPGCTVTGFQVTATKIVIR